MPRTFVFHTDYGEILDVALALQAQGEKVLFYVKDQSYKKIGEGLIEHIDDWHDCLGEKYIWIFDGCSHGRLQDWLRERGEFVFGGSEKADALENDRQLGQKMFKAAGFKQPESHNFRKIEEAVAFLEENTDKRWILKQNGDAPKSINHMQKFESGQDMMLHLEHLKRSWNFTEYGEFSCDLMEIIEGTEVAASAFWNGSDWMRDKNGKVVGYLNWEHKKECDGDLGATTGEMGTLFLGVNEDNELFSDILLRPEIAKVLKESNFRGVFDINGTVTEDGDFVGFEPTCRFGVPASSYEFVEGLESGLGDLLENVARGVKSPVEVKLEVGMVMVCAAKPFPVESHLEDDATSMGEILWFIEDGEESLEPTDEQMRHIHLYNFYKDEEQGQIRVATDSGYLFTVTGHGRTVEGVRSDLIEYIKKNVYISGMKYRLDIGKRVERFVEEMKGEKERILIDFDNVIHEHDEDSEELDGEPVDGAFDAIEKLVKKGFAVSIFTARTDVSKVKKWLDGNFEDWRKYIDSVSNTKAPATVYIDDRALRFESWKQVGEEIAGVL